MSVPALELRLLGPPVVLRAGKPVRLPPSRKARALLGYLALAPHPVPRERLCSLLWDVPDDPRGELRWCLSKLRALLDDGSRRRVLSADDRIRLDLEGCPVDALAVETQMRDGLDRLDTAALRALADRFAGEFMEGVLIERAIDFGHWLAGERSRFRSHLADIRAAIATQTPAGDAEGLSAARAWLEVAPFDPNAHIRFLAELHHRRMIEDGNRHLAAATKAFADAGADIAPVADAFDAMRRSTPASPASASAAPPPGPGDAVAGSGPVADARRQASVAVMPFREAGPPGVARSRLGDALTHDVISRLARLRSLFVIARGSVFALADESIETQELGRRLGVEYIATGMLSRDGDRLAATVDVVEAATARIISAQTFEARSPDRFAVIERIGDEIVAAIAAEIETAERNRAVLKPPDSLDAWEAYHRGLWHMYRFTPEENAQAAELFRLSARLDPTFSRAHAGLSFTHWQNAFQGWGDRAAEARLSLEAAKQSLFVDEHNPSAHWSVGRALWLAGDNEAAVGALERSVDISPNFALGHYALSFVHSQSGDPDAAIRSSDYSRLLSPYDPLLFGMLGARAMAHVRLGAFAEAAEWAMKAAARPNAHTIILAIAAHCLALAGRVEEARGYAARILRQNPDYRANDFLEAFRFAPDAVAQYRKAAALVGFRR